MYGPVKTLLGSSGRPDVMTAVLEVITTRLMFANLWALFSMFTVALMAGSMMSLSTLSVLGTC